MNSLNLKHGSLKSTDTLLMFQKLPQIEPINWIIILLLSILVFWINISYLYFYIKNINIKNNKNTSNKINIHLFKIKW